jgi:DNA helicase-2/ATP-dependent DNA helicase PcrA
VRERRSGPFRSVQVHSGPVTKTTLFQYQDTNKVQYDLLKLLTHGNKALTIVGDPDQSIYGFRNADVTNFLKMKDDYRNVQVARLEQNYRSTTAILNAASVVINNGKEQIQRMEGAIRRINVWISALLDQSRIPKELYTHNCDGVPMSWLLYNRPEDEAEALVEEILRVQKFSNGIMTNEDFCILVRINSFTLNYERELSRKQIPYRVVRWTTQ